MSIEVIAFEYFSALLETGINSYTKSFPLHAVFRYFFNDSKQNDATTTSLIKRLIELLKETILMSSLIKIW